MKWKFAHGIEELLDVTERIAQSDFESGNDPVMRATARPIEGRRLVVYPWKRHNHEKKVETPNPAAKTPHELRTRF
jgi:hypothetical protein